MQLVDEKTEENSGFLVKSKKYKLDKTDIVVLNVINQTSSNYIVRIKGTYLNKEGQEITSEEQSFDQFSTGFQNNFLFNPGFTFESFTYTIQTTPTDAVMYTPNIDLQFHKLVEMEVPDFSLSTQGDHTFYPTIVAEFMYQNKNEAQIHVTGYWILINSKEEVIRILEIGTIVGNLLEAQHEPLYFTKEEKLIWPEEMQGEIRGVYAIKTVVVQ